MALADYYDSEKERELVNDVVAIHDYYMDQLADVYKPAADDWSLFFGRTKDWRLPNEMWRAFIHVPRPYSTTLAHLAQIWSAMTSVDPMIQAESIQPGRESMARVIQDNLDYILRANRFQWSLLPQAILSTLIQGLQFIKVGYTIKKIPYWNKPPDPEGMRRFLAAVQTAAEVTKTKPPQDPAAFEQWRNDVMLTAPNLEIPAPPSEGKQDEIISYRGPRLTLPSLFDMRFDPRIGSVQDQPILIQRSVVSEDWVVKKADPNDPTSPFDTQAVKDAQGGGRGDQRFNQWQDQQAKAMGIESSALDTFQGKTPVELLEVTQPSVPGAQRLVIMNRRCVINKTPERMPHGLWCHPYVALKHLDVAGFQSGPGILRLPRKLFLEHDRLRSFKLDALAMGVLPVFGRSGATQLTSIEIRPGLVVPVGSNGRLEQLNRDMPGVASIFREEDSIRADEDEATATGANVRGATALVGRIPATTDNSRLTQAQLRDKLELAGYQGELTDLVPMMLMVLYTRSSSDVRVRMGQGTDPLGTIPRDSLIEALTMDFRFRGSANSIDKEAQFQGLGQFYDKVGPILPPKNMAALVRQMYESLGIKNVEAIVGGLSEYLTARAAQAGVGGPGGAASAPDAIPALPPTAGPQGTPVQVGG